MEKKRKRHVLTPLKTNFTAKNQKNLSRGSPGKLSERDRERERDRETETDPNIRGLRTLSLSRRTNKILGSFQPNPMTKFKVIDKKPSKNGNFS